MSTSAAAASGIPTDHAHDEHSSFIKTPQQLLVVLFLSFAVPIAGILLLVSLVVGEHGVDPVALEPKAVAARILPVGSVEVVDANAPKVYKSGEEVVKTVCAACHMTGAANAPRIGDKAAWAPRLKLGLDGLTKSSVAGKGAMPARGGVPDLSDFELVRAIVNMTSQSGGSFKEPAAPAAAAAAPAADAKAAAKDGSKTGSPASSAGTPAAAPVASPKDAPAAAKK